MSDRFFVESPIHGNLASLTGQEAIHLAKVLRARVGQEIILFDGQGSEFLARIVDLQRHQVNCQILETRPVNREIVRRIAMGVALPKGDRQKFLIEKLTELGVHSLTPLKTDRGVVQPDGQTVERLRRAVIEASKQCGRNRLLEIHTPCQASEFFTSTNSIGLRLIAHPDDATRISQRLSEMIRKSPSKDVAIAIGPEGGFTENELSHAAQAGWLFISLGPGILRIETAAIAAAAIAGADIGTDFG